MPKKKKKKHEQGGGRGAKQKKKEFLKKKKKKKKKHEQGEGRGAKENTPLLQDCLSWKFSPEFPSLSFAIRGHLHYGLSFLVCSHLLNWYFNMFS